LKSIEKGIYANPSSVPDMLDSGVIPVESILVKPFIRTILVFDVTGFLPLLPVRDPTFDIKGI
jgi:hypothetical protein